MAPLKMQRGSVRAVFSKTLKEFQELLKKKERDSILEQQLFARLEDHHTKLEVLDEKVMSEMLVNATITQDEFNQEYELISEYKKNFTDIQVLYNSINLQETKKENQKTQYRLPKLEFQKFGGDPKDWLRFWSQFSSIHEDKSMTPGEKFQYILQSTVEGSKAREVINSFPPTGENYAKAVAYLKERYGKDEVLVEVYVRDMLKLVLDSSLKKGVKISSLYDKLETQLRALETLGVTQEKYASMLYPLVESCLPEETLRTWERQRHSTAAEEGVGVLQRLMKFLRGEVEGEERVLLAKGSFSADVNNDRGRKSRDRYEENTPTAIDLFNGTKENSSKCVFCEKSHPAGDCFAAAKMSFEKKKKIVGEKKACFQCLRRGHMARECKGKISCQACGKKHLVIMCPESVNNKSAEKKVEGEGAAVTNLSSYSSGSVMLQTLLVYVEGPRETRCVRAMIDTGSQRSYISQKAVEVLGLKAAEEVKLRHCVFGGATSAVKTHGEFQIVLRGVSNNHQVSLCVLNQSVICGKITRGNVGPWREELSSRGVNLSDVGEGCPDIHILIGADYAGTLFTGKIVRTESGPVAMETVLGWTVMGSICENQSREDVAMLVTALSVSDMDIQNLWKLDAIGINDPSETITKEEEVKSAEEHFQKTVTINKEGRYEVNLPWLECHPVVANNFEIAKRRLISATKKVNSLGLYEVYQKIFDTWEEDGVVEKVPAGGSDLSGSYLPHHPVIKETSLTTPVRPVFNASAKSGGGAALNECLQKGNTLVELIPDLFLRFRMKKIGVISDVKKAYLQISLTEKERDYVRFLWWKEDKKTIQEYRHCRAVFGVTSSPFLLAATLSHHMKNYQDEHSEVISIILKSLYIDNIVSGFDSIEETMQFKEISTTIFAEGKFELRGWKWTGCDSTEESRIESVLGARWDVIDDTFGLDLRGINKMSEELSKSLAEESGVSLLGSSGCGLDSGKVKKGKVTKRIILSAAQKVFDTVGVACPVTIVPKKLLQEVWLQKLTWDEPVSAETGKKFLKWLKEFPALEEVKLSRWILKENVKEDQCSLHVFCDASLEAYAGCVFIRSEDNNGNVEVQLISAKARVSPTKKTTIPRLELLGCLVAARLSVSVQKVLEMQRIRKFFWTDSSNALYWIVKRENWSTFVWNRVEEIRKLTDVKDWRHVPGELNPADLPSRGCGAKALVTSRWWEGPSWLRLPENQWPKSEVKVDQLEVLKECKKVVAVNISTSSKPWYVNRFSKFRKVVRLTAWMLRWKSNQVKSSELTLEEELQAELCLWKAVQESNGFNSKSQLVKQLNGVQGGEGVWRVETKLVYREDKDTFKFPILLPASDQLVETLIRDMHLKFSHCGIQVLLSLLREKYWIPKGRQVVRKIVKSCTRCRRFTEKGMETVQAPLPLDRIRDAAVFEVVGVDLGGPLHLKEKKKVWFVVFTCAVYRCAHLELVTSLSTECFIQSFRRFIARRGRPTSVYSDNGTNFEGISNALDRVDWKEVQKFADCEKILWNFSPPSAPWWGGFWERIVGMVKKILRRVLGRASLDYEEMLTVLTDCEDIINSRPLTYISEEIEDLQPLTPNMFLRDIRSATVADLDQLDRKAANKRFQYRQKLKEDLRNRFRSEYLGLLVHRLNCHPKIKLKVGDVVLIGSDLKKRQDWPMGRVVELFSGRDGVNRVANVKTSQGMLERPVKRLHLLEVSKEEESAGGEDKTGVAEGAYAEGIVTRSGLQLKSSK